MNAVGIFYVKKTVISFITNLPGGSSSYEYAFVSLFFTALITLVLPNIGTITFLHFLFMGIAFVTANVLWFILAMLFFKKANSFTFIIAHSLTLFFLIINTYHYTIFEEHLDLNALFVAATGILSGEAKIGLGNYTAFFQQGSYVAIAVGMILYGLLIIPMPRNGNPFAINIMLTIGFAAILGFFNFSPIQANEKNYLAVHRAIPYFNFVNSPIKYPLEDFGLQATKSTRQLEAQQINVLKTLRKEIQNNQLELNAEIKPNILFLHLESLRSDMMSPDYMPNLYEWGRTKGEILSNHYSTASNTTTGMFGLIHGLTGSYFQSITMEDYFPITLDILKTFGYSMATYHGKSLDYDNMYRRFFKATRDHDYWPRHSEITKNDEAVLEQLYEDIKNNQSVSKPRFDYVKLDATHWNYKYPAAFEKFKPVLDSDFRISSMTNLHMKGYKEELLNRYKNSAYYTDHIVNLFLNKIEALGYLENSIIIIVGDHGEEFWEHNRFGHIYGMSKEQTQVVSVIHFPKAVDTQYKTTSHQDIFPTIFDYMKVNIEPSKIFSGKNLYEYHEDKDFAVVSLGTIGRMSRFSEAVIEGDLKVEYRLKDKLKIVKVSNATDIERLDFTQEEINTLITKAVQMKHILPKE
jgi:membrane-anchored protein YejM (alkaline phosphatase superfamily)